MTDLGVNLDTATDLSWLSLVAPGLNEAALSRWVLDSGWREHVSRALVGIAARRLVRCADCQSLTIRRQGDATAKKVMGGTLAGGVFPDLCPCAIHPRK